MINTATATLEKHCLPHSEMQLLIIEQEGGHINSVQKFSLVLQFQVKHVLKHVLKLDRVSSQTCPYFSCFREKAQKNSICYGMNWMQQCPERDSYARVPSMWKCSWDFRKTYTAIKATSFPGSQWIFQQVTGLTLHELQQYDFVDTNFFLTFTKHKLLIFFFVLFSDKEETQNNMISVSLCF